MAKAEYHPFVPINDGETVRWGNNLDIKITTLGPTLGMLPPALTDLKDDLQVVIEALNRAIVKKREQQEAITFKNLVRGRELKRITKTLIALKLHPAYTENIGNELGIIGVTTVLNRLTLTTSIRLAIFPGLVEVHFKKKRQAGVSIFSKLLGDENWTLVDNTTVTPYKDTRPLKVAGVPEVRQYMARFWDGDQHYGMESEAPSILYKG
jgi:hypothetical protein